MNKDRFDQEAEQALDRNDYATARELYRQAASLADPMDDNSLTIILSNSGFAVEMDQLLFLRSVVERNPESLTCALAEVSWLIHINSSACAVWICNKLLAQHSSAPLALHIARLRAALSDRNSYPLILEDSPIIWESAGRMDNPQPTRALLLSELARCKDPTIVPVFLQLLRQSWMTPAIQRFLQTKVEELVLLQELNNTVTRETGSGHSEKPTEG
jgi:hypothetical protein